MLDFMELFYIGKRKNALVAGHAGHNNYTEKPKNMIIARDERLAKIKWRYAGNYGFGFYVIE